MTNWTPESFRPEDFQAMTTDSRKVRPGSIFFALKGDAFDGHDFIDAALTSGAKWVICEKGRHAPHPQISEVDSTLSEIRRVSKIYRNRFSIPVIAVVGAVGKTTTKELLASLLSVKFPRLLKTEGSQNGFLGIPLTLLTLKPDTDLAIIEVGIDEIGAMIQHMDLVQPTHVILTANGPEHLHQLKTVDSAAEEELKAFDYALNKTHVKIAANLSDPYVANYLKHWCEKNRSSFAPDQVRTYQTGDSIGELQCPLPGDHHRHNLLGAVTLCKFFQVTDPDLMQGLATFKTAYGRTEIHRLANGGEVIADYYNSNPTSLAAALKLLSERAPIENRIAVLADMLELGTGEEQFHRDIADLLKVYPAPHIFLFGPRMKWLKDELDQRAIVAQHFSDYAVLVPSLKKQITPQSVMLIKGSRGMKMEQVFKAIST